eukprot:snap_masked-scaffold_148-processed-gene-0.3-mRNA-1 protein AED:1.00 eAED:1.00 QI:0/0/0/0/1/1/2/0/868
MKENNQDEHLPAISTESSPIKQEYSVKDEYKVSQVSTLEDSPEESRKEQEKEKKDQVASAHFSTLLLMFVLYLQQVGLIIVRGNEYPERWEKSFRWIRNLVNPEISLNFEESGEFAFYTFFFSLPFSLHSILVIFSLMTNSSTRFNVQDYRMQILIRASIQLSAIFCALSLLFKNGWKTFLVCVFLFLGTYFYVGTRVGERLKLSEEFDKLPGETPPFLEEWRKASFTINFAALNENSTFAFIFTPAGILDIIFLFTIQIVIFRGYKTEKPDPFHYLCMETDHLPFDVFYETLIIYKQSFSWLQVGLLVEKILLILPDSFLSQESFFKIPLSGLTVAVLLFLTISFMVFKRPYLLSSFNWIETISRISNLSLLIISILFTMDIIGENTADMIMLSISGTTLFFWIIILREILFSLDSWLKYFPLCIIFFYLKKKIKSFFLSIKFANSTDLQEIENLIKKKENKTITEEEWDHLSFDQKIVVLCFNRENTDLESSQTLEENEFKMFEANESLIFEDILQHGLNINQNIICLDLSYCNITAIGLKYMIDKNIFSKLPNLKILRIIGSKIELGSNLFYGMKEIKSKLETFDLGSNKLNQDHAVEISHFLVECENLKEVYIRKNSKLGFIGNTFILLSVVKSTLCVLNLHRTGLEDKNLIGIFGVISLCKNLIEFDVSVNKLSNTSLTIIYLMLTYLTNNREMKANCWAQRNSDQKQQLLFQMNEVSSAYSVNPALHFGPAKCLSGSLASNEIDEDQEIELIIEQDLIYKVPGVCLIKDQWFTFDEEGNVDGITESTVNVINKGLYGYILGAFSVIDGEDKERALKAITQYDVVNGTNLMINWQSQFEKSKETKIEAAKILESWKSGNQNTG